LPGKLVGQTELAVAVQHLLGVGNEPYASHAGLGHFVSLGWVPYIVAVAGHGLVAPGAIVDPAAAAAAVPVADMAGDGSYYILGLASWRMDSVQTGWV
jgi:hypothetical protein